MKKKIRNATKAALRVWMGERETWVAPGTVIEVESDFSPPGFEAVIDTPIRQKKGETK